MSFWRWLPSLIPAAATIYGASQASKASKQDTTAANQANQKATDASIQAQREATAAELEKLAVAERLMQAQQRQASPGLVGLQQIIGRGEALTPEQELALEDARRNTANALAGSSLRGSARATAASIQDVEGRMRTGFIDSNRSRADAAAGQLSGQYFNAGDNLVNIAGAQGDSASKGLINIGTANRANIIGTGQNDVDNLTRQSTIKGSAIGDIAAVISDQIKQDSKPSSYKEVHRYGNETVTFDSPRRGVL